MAQVKTITKSFKYRIYPTKSQVRLFEHTLDLCRELYNASLQERRDAYRYWLAFWQREGVEKPKVNYYSQNKELPALKAARPELKAVHSQVLQDVLRRSDKSFAGV